MWQRDELMTGWLQRAPRWTAAMLAGLIVADLTHSAWLFRPVSPDVLPQTPSMSPPRAAAFDVQRVVTAHLFGGGGKRLATEADAAGAPETQLALALSGIIATRNPQDGYAILGEQGKPGHLYRVGAPLEIHTGGLLFRVFVDRVVLDIDGRLETLTLPRALLPGLSQVRPLEATNVATAAETAAASAAAEVDERQVSPVQTLFGTINAEPNNVDGRMAGMVLHPAKRLQHQYGIRDGDMLTAVNGVEITDADVLASALKSSEKSLSLTFTRDGVEQTKTLQINN
jgi:general secretion pathway protein C